MDALNLMSVTVAHNAAASINSNTKVGLTAIPRAGAAIFPIDIKVNQRCKLRVISINTLAQIISRIA
tara:strand:+ start:1128 stop:1328 length:201 start_codon:yes stop_codon:yes gene_type:complete